MIGNEFKSLKKKKYECNFQDGGETVGPPGLKNSPKKYYPQLVTLGQSVDLAFIAQKMQDRSSLSIGDIKSTMQNFVEKLKEQLLEGKTVNIAGLGVFILAAKSKGEEKADDVTAKSVESVRICFQANRELKISKAATRAGERLDLVSLDDYLKGKTSTDGGSGSEGGGSDSDGDQGENPLG